MRPTAHRIDHKVDRAYEMLDERLRAARVVRVNMLREEGRVLGGKDVLGRCKQQIELKVIGLRRPLPPRSRDTRANERVR